LQLEAVAKMFVNKKAETEQKGEKAHGLLALLVKQYKDRGFDFITQQKLTYHVNKLLVNKTTEAVISPSPL
jgi:hypothetical protein